MSNYYINKGEIKDEYTFQYGIPQKVIDIYGKYIHFRNLEFLDGMGTFEAEEDVQELKRLHKLGAIIW